MKITKLKSLLIILLVGITSINTFGQDCLNFGNMNAPLNDYNNDSIYPAGSVLLNSGDLDLIKTKKQNNPSSFWDFTNIIYVNSSDIGFNGYLTFDVSKASYSCKELVFKALAEKIIVGNDTINSITFGVFAPYVGNGYTLDTLGGGNIEVKGAFNTVSIWAQTGIVYDACLSNCSTSSNCLNFGNMNAPIADYNNDSIYPAGSVLLNSGDLDLIKTKKQNNPSSFWDFTNIIYANSTDIGFNGYLTFDVSKASYSCKELVFKALAEKIIVDNDTINSITFGVFAPYVGNGYTIDTLGGGNIEVKGAFNVVSIWAQTGIVYNACLSNCSTSISTCIIADDLDPNKVNSSPGGYNDDNTYPAGSVLASQNNMSIIKTFGYTSSPSNTQLGALSNGQLVFWGGLTFDMSASTYSCKKLTLRVSGGGVTTIYADNDTLLNRNGYTVTQIAFDHYEIQGTFNTVTFIDQSTSMFTSACLEDCSINTSSCMDFQDTTLGVAVPISQTNYGAIWYSYNGVTFKSKYSDPMFMGNPGSVTIADHVAAGYTGSNGATNFVGNIFYQGFAITEIDFSALVPLSKKVEFDVNYIENNTSANPYYINGQSLSNLPAGVTYTTTPLTNGFHVVLTGNINTIEVHGHEVAIDNMCADTISVTPPPASACMDFQDTTLGVAVPISQTNYGAIWYSYNGVTFKSKYSDPMFMGNPGSVTIADHVAAGYTGSNGATNFVGNIFYQGFAITEIDFSALVPLSKKVEFDVNYIENNTSANPYYINGQSLSNLPAGVTYTTTPLTNGFHVVLTGNINTIEVHGHEVALDNMCVDSATSPCNNYIGFTFTTTPNGVQFTNTSSHTPTTADQFMWDFGDGNTSGNNNPLHNYTAPGTYYVCLTIVDWNCPNPTMHYCDTVVIGGCPNGHRIITPNNDGEADEVFIPAKSKIYDRNGFMVKEITQDMNWKGRDKNNQDLPMGYYTITCGNGDGVFNVTIVR